MSSTRRLCCAMPIALMIVLTATAAAFAWSPSASVRVEQAVGFDGSPAHCGPQQAVDVRVGYISESESTPVARQSFSMQVAEGALGATDDTVPPSLTKVSPNNWANQTRPSVVIEAVEETSGIDETSTVFTLEGSASGSITGSGSWTGLAYTFTPNMDLREGEIYTARMRVADKAGNYSWQYQWTFRVDITGPVIDHTSWSIAEGAWIDGASPYVSVYVSDTGGSGVNVWTSQATVTGDGAVRGKVLNPETGEYTIELANLGDGPHTATLVYIEDFAGNPAEPRSVTFNVDTGRPTQPQVSVPYLTNEATPMFTWSGASDAAPSGGIASYFVDIWKTGEPGVYRGPYTVEHTSDPHSWRLPDALANDGTDDGTYLVGVWSRDVAGNFSTSYGLSPFMLDTTAPREPTTVTGPGKTNSMMVWFAWSGATDPEPSGGIAGYTVEIWKAGDSAASKGPYKVMHRSDPQTLCLWGAFAEDGSDDGIYQIRVWTNDEAGNTSSSCASDTFVLDTQPPTLSGGAPTGYTRSTAPTVSADFADAGVGLDASETALMLTYNGGSTDIRSGFAGAPSYADGDTATRIEYTLTTALADGMYTVDMAAYDLLGIRSTPDPTLRWTFNVDTKPPTDPGSPAAGNAHDNGSWYVSTLRPTFSWAVSRDPDADDGTLGSGVREYWFQFGAEAGKPGPAVDAWPDAVVDKQGISSIQAAGIQQWTPSDDLPIVAGVAYSARVKAFDNVGNASGWADPIIVYDPNRPTAPGTPVAVTPTADRTPSWQWPGSIDDMSGVDGYHIQIRRRGSVDWDVFDTFVDIPDALTPANPQVWEQGLQLESGSYEIRVQAMDVAGNYSEWSGIGSVTVDASPPAVPAIKALSAGHNESPIMIDWSDVTDGSNSITYILQYADNAGFDGRTDATGLRASNYSFDAGAAGEGEYWFRVKTISTLPGAGGTKESGWSAIVSTVYDKTAPAAPLMDSLPPFANDAALTFEWSTSFDAVKYELSYSTDGGGTWNQMILAGVKSDPVGVSDVPDGVAVIGRVRAYDRAGNMSDYSDAVQTIIDRTGPVVTIEAPSDAITTNAATFAYEWRAVDAGCGVRDCTVVFNGGEYQATATGGGNDFAWTGALLEGDNTFRVWATDKLGNKSAVVDVPVVRQATPQISGVRPMPGVQYKINEISTIAFQVVGLHDAPIEVRLNGGEPLDPWRIVTVLDAPTMAKFYILLDGEVLAPGTMAITITIGAESGLFIYEVSPERSGFGFGRLRPW